MPQNDPPQPQVNVRQPPGGYPQGAVPFLRALVAPDAAALMTWAAGARPDAQWAEWLHRQELAPFALFRLRQVGALAGLPAEFVSALRRTYYNAVSDAELHMRELADVLAALAAADVTPVLYKGAALAYTAYPEPSCRLMGDLDLWIDPEAMPRAQAALEGLRYEQRVRAERPLSLQAQRRGEVQLVGRNPGAGLVELHWGVFAGEWQERTAAVDEAAVRARCLPLDVLGHPVRTLAPEDAVIQLAAHLAINHQFTPSWLRGFLDIVLTARWRHVDWDVVADRAREWRVATAVWLVHCLAADLWGLDEAAHALECLRPSPLRRWLLSLLVNPRSLLEMRNLRREPQKFILQLLLADRLRDAARLLWRALWPEDDWLAARYGRGDARMRYRHLLSAVRGKI